MPSLTFPIGPNGLLVPVVVAQDQKAIADALTRGLPVSAPIQVVGELDTGCNATAITQNVVRQLNLAATGGSSTTTAAGLAPVNLYEVSLSIVSSAGPAGPIFTIPHLDVPELPFTLPIDVLIGLDVILQCDLHIYGRQGIFTIDF
jgi:hypothetical protein